MSGINDIVGVYCPMGCGESLHLMPSGMIVCMHPRCPDKGAAQKILSDSEPEHIVVFGEDSFTVRHPLRDRLGDLFACEIHSACNSLPGPPDGRTGRYRAWFGESGNLVLQPAPDTQ